MSEKSITIHDPFGKGDIEIKFVPYDKQKVAHGVKKNMHFCRDETFDEYMEEELKKFN